METFEYTHQCPNCEKEWREVRLDPIQYTHHKKVCKECLSTTGVSVQDLAGLHHRDQKCENCIHFNPVHEGWGECGLGNELDNEDEYTLTWAIDNIAGCLVGFEEHTSYGDDIRGMVYILDLCEQYEGDDGY